MATLTETAYYSRKIIKFGGIGVVAFLILRSLLLAGVAYYRKLNPPPPPPPTVLFGRLPELVFPDSSAQVLSYKLETVTGTAPDLGDRTTVYFMPVRQANLLALERMQSLAARLDFKEEPEQISPRKYEWTRDEPLGAKMVADIVSGSFALSVSWQQDLRLLSSKALPSGEEAVKEAVNFLQNAGIWASDLSSVDAQVSFYKADVNEMVSAVSLSEADFVRVDFYRNAIEESLVYTPNPKRGSVSLTFSGNKTRGKRVVEVKYNWFEVNYDEMATYPIKPSSQAWNELKAGEGYIASIDSGIDEVVVRQISLGFYDSAVPQYYLQPIYVFVGDNNFIGFVQAVSQGWIEGAVSQ